eukprot:TRINITY_DN878_c0_g2_i2.p1 TRINITY_DN878_c0_g2~~TRINITY_DN878_c0_g2_i2.p1  ORF type:complete len:287 (+),score=63.61 TRINITY_DN878_c0_g2_i2:209-1069(+)
MSDEDRSRDFLDNILLQTFDKSGTRKHFPVILESNDHAFFNRRIFELMQVREDWITSIEWMGWESEEDAVRFLDHIYSRAQVNRLYTYLGQNISDWHEFTQELLKMKAPTLDKALTKENPWLMRGYNQFRRKMNRLVMSRQLTEELDAGDIKYRVLDVFERWRGLKPSDIAFVGEPLSHWFLEQPIILAMLESNIFYLWRYRAYLTPQREMSRSYFFAWIQELRKGMTLGDKIRYSWNRRRRYGLVNFNNFSKKQKDRLDDKRIGEYEPKIAYQKEFQLYLSLIHI